MNSVDLANERAFAEVKRLCIMGLDPTTLRQRVALAPRYRELLGPAGFGYELRGALTTGKQLWGGLCLSREKGRPDFTAREVDFMRRVAPHLGAGLRAATFQQELHDDQKDSNDDAAGVLVFDQDGTVVQHNAAAEHRLEELGDISERGGEVGRDSRRPSGRCSAP